MRNSVYIITFCILDLKIADSVKTRREKILTYQKYLQLHETSTKLSEVRIMRLIRINFFAPCTMRYTSIKYTNSKISDSSVDSVKTRIEKILAYIEVREFSLFRSFDARCAARCDFYIPRISSIL